MSDLTEPVKGHGIVVWRDGDMMMVKYAVWMFGFLGTKIIPVANIVAFKWQEPGSWTSGFLEIEILGEQAPASYSSPNVRNQNRLRFDSPQREQFAAFRDWIQSKMASGRSEAKKPGVADEISKLATLLHQGLLTREEFDQQKAKLLA